MANELHMKASSDLAKLMPAVARELLGEPNGELSRADELRFGSHGSLAVNVEAGTWYSHEEESGGGVLDLIAHQLGMADRTEQLAWLERQGHLATRQPKPKPKMIAAYDYLDESGNLLLQAVRMEPKSFRQRRPDGRGGWVWSVKGIRQVPYRLQGVLSNPEADIYLVEGEKDADRLAELGLVATCNAGGAGKWTDEHSAYLTGRQVVILPDNDEPGIDHARKAKASLESAGAKVAVIMLPDLPEKGDVSDWLDSGGTPEQLEALVAAGGSELPAGAEERDSGGEDEEKRSSQADLAVTHVCTWNELFHDDNRYAYARHRDTGEVRKIRSDAFKLWLMADFYRQFEKSLRDQSRREAGMTLEGLAMEDFRPVHVRVAGAKGDYWLDLGEPGNSRAVHLTPGKWILEEPELMFSRSETSQTLPEPMPGGAIEPLWQIANIPDGYRLLVVAWLIECLRPDTPYPVLELLGEHGSAKSTTQTAMRRLIDPNAADLRGVPKSAEDLFVSGGVNHFLSIENVSHLPAPLQDALCVISTGGGFAKRMLYTDSEESVINLKRPVVLNGIAATVTQQDLVSRTLTIEMPVIESAQAKDSLEGKFGEHRAQILGGLLDIAAAALCHLPDMTLPPSERPRLVEFAYLGMAVAKAMGVSPGVFLEQFSAARQDGLERTLDASPVATAIRDWAEIHPGEVQEMPAKVWLTTLEDYKPRGCDSWPRSAKGLGDAMRRAAPALRQLGIVCQCLGKVGGTVKWRIGIREADAPAQADFARASGEEF